MNEAAEDGARRRPHIPFGLPEAAGASAAGEHRDLPGFAAAEYGQHAPAPARPIVETLPETAAVEPLPSLDPAAIAAELGLAFRDAAALLRARRDFAFRNHPDRVGPSLRERAARRMQIANALIDEALRRAIRT